MPDAARNREDRQRLPAGSPAHLLDLAQGKALAAGSILRLTTVPRT
jgi:hypothetical protein